MKFQNKIAFISCLILSSHFCKAQTYLLLDRRWYEPAVITDSVTRGQLSEGWFPIYKTELDSLLTLVGKLKNLKDDGLNRKFFYSEDFKTEHLVFQIENIKRTYGDGYEINLVNKGTFGTITLKLSDPKLLLTENQRTVRGFLTYLNRTKADLEKPIKRKKKNTKSNPLID